MFHRIEDPYQLGSSRFFRLAGLLPSYSGATSARLQQLAAAEQQAPTAAPVPAPAYAELPPETLAAISQAGTEGRAMPSIECD